MKTNELFNENNRVTYCPEDDKIRLYVGRVPREEYEALRAEGWTSTPKQDCDFVAVWTPSREDTALSYAGIIEDEDAGPDERAADRAERFGGYLDKRLAEAVGHADRYDSGPACHGYQSEARAVRAADRHDRSATRAVNAWDKAEYWQTRTAGVISHALYLQSPGVRMGRIKTIEAEIRAAEKAAEKAATRRAWVAKVAADTAGAVAAIAARNYGGETAEATRDLCEEIAGYGKHRNPAPNAAPDSPPDYYFEHAKSEHPPTVADYAARYLRTHAAPDSPEWEQTGTARTLRHLRLRIAYENQMIEAQGGRAASVEMVKGGTLGGRVIAKVNKSAKTGRVVSVAVVGPHTGERWTYGATNEPGTSFALYSVETERLAPGSYSEPTPESLAKLAEFEDAKKAAAAKAPKTPSLINPTLEDAERLQALLNAAYLAEWTRQHGDPSRSCYKPRDPGEVCAIPQEVYSANSSGAYAKAETRELCAGGVFASRSRNRKNPAPVVCKIRTTGYDPLRVVHITDKPAKPLPASVWEAYTAPVSPESAPV